MQALVLEADQQLVYHPDVPIPPPPTPDSLLIQVAACGICGSDLPRGFGGKAYHYPLIMGHEFSGIVAEDRQGSQFRQGDRVVIFPLIPTNTSEGAYQTGDWAQLQEYDYFGSRRDGAFAEFLRVPETNLFRIPEHVDTHHAAMTEPAAVALHGVRHMSVTAGNTGVVIGAGPIGNMCAQWLRIHGCQRVIVTDVDERKLEIASAMGFIPVDSTQTDPVQKIMELTDGQGAQNVIEACGLPTTFLQALAVASRAGEVVFMGNIVGEFTIGEKAFSSILRRELKIYGTWNSKIFPKGNDDWTTVLRYMDRELQVAPLISDRVALQQGPEVFQSILQRQKFHNKVIFEML
jgi:L-iditol 2-dehydrogenase/galactitol-1-phosphate 5-dehydrogenase